MYAITGITGKVGGHVANGLLEAGKTIRAVVRSSEKGAPWLAKGCEVAIASSTDVDGLRKAFAGAQGVFLMNPPNYDPAPGFPGTRQIIAALLEAIRDARPEKVVFLSTVGGHVQEFSLLNNSRMTEEALRTLPLPVAFLRAGWFMENASWSVGAARDGVIPSYLQPLDHPIPMVATTDIGRVAVELLQESWTGTRVVELEGPKRYSANDIARGFGAALGRDVTNESVQRDTWEQEFIAQGMKHPLPRMRMLDGFNEGWIDFESKATVRKGSTTLESVLAELVAKA